MKKLLLACIIVCQCNFSYGQRDIINDIGESHVMVKGTKISIVPPKDFTVAANFAGFQQTESSASIMVLDIPGPFSEISKGFTKEGLKSQAMTFVASETLKFQGLKAMFLTVQQEAYGQIFKKHILAFGNEKETTFINGTFPADRNELGDAIKTALLTAHYDSSKKIDPFSTVDFEINAGNSGLVFTKNMANSLIYTRDGQLPSQSEDQANFIVGKAFSEVIVVNQEEFANTRLRQLPIEIDSIVSTQSVDFDGLKGVEIIAEGKNPRNGNPENVYQVILFEDTLYYIILGSCEANFEENIQMFQEMAKTFKRK